MTDPIADYLTRIRNAYLAGNKVVEMPSSKMKESLTKILCERVTSSATRWWRLSLRIPSKSL